MIRAVVFDLFETLVDLNWERLPRVDLGTGPVPTTTAALHAAVARRTPIDLATFAAKLAECDAGFRDRRWAEGREIHTEERFAALLPLLGLDEPALAEELTRIHMQEIASVVSTPPHHAGVLDALQRTVRLAVCSNFSHAPTARGILARDGLDERFDAIVVSADVGYRKPRKEIFERVLSQMQVEPGHVLHVGDQLRADIGGAAAMGMHTVWITRRIPDPDAERYEGITPDHVVADLAEVAEIVRVYAFDS